MLLRSGKRSNPNQSDIEEKLSQLHKKFDLLFREMQSIKLEMQDNKFKKERLENNPNKKTTGGHRANRENRNDRRRDESVHMPSDDND